MAELLILIVVSIKAQSFERKFKFVLFSGSGGPRFFHNQDNYIYTKFDGKNPTLHNLLLH